jgi:antitoxin component YwqK of YwqJK toxin-antitoxin module
MNIKYLNSFSDGVLNGRYYTFYKNNSPKEFGFYNNNLKDGIWLLWTETGKLKRKEIWKNGRIIKRYFY